MPESVPDKKYWAFISYSSKDRKWGQWLHKRLENYPIPKEFQGEVLFDGTILGKNLRPIFRDRDELTGSAELGPAIQRALTQSRYLIVLCSPDSARSLWVNKEIENFKLLGGEKNILALILDGEPNASSKEGVQALECFPPALRYPAEPLAGDLRKEGDGKERGFLKVLAGIAQLDFDALYRRHERAQRRRRAGLSMVSLAIIVSLALLAGVAWVQKQRAEVSEREAKLQRDQARGNLARLYREKAGKSNASSSESLAWVVEAARTDPSLLSLPSFQGQVSSWLGPFPGPDRCMGTGFKRASEKWNDSTKHHISRVHQRLLVQSTDQAWRLLGWSGGEPLASGLCEQPARFFESVEDGAWFAFVGIRMVEVRSWQDGRLIARTMLPQPGTISHVTTAGGRLFLAVLDESANPKVSRLLSWNPLEEKTPRHEGNALEGDLATIWCFVEGEQTSMIGSLRRNDESRLIYWAQEMKDGPWLPVELENAGRLSTFYRPVTNTPPGVMVLRDDQTWCVVDALKREDFVLNLVDREHVIAIRRDKHGLIALVHDDKEIVSEIDIGTGNGRRLLDERPLSRPVMDAKTGTLFGWDAEGQSLGIAPVGKACEWRALVLPKGLSLVTMGVVPLNEALVLIDGYTRPDSYPVVVMVDLKTQGEEGMHVVRVAGYEDFLSAGVQENGDCSAKLLSHNGAAISVFDKIASMAAITAQQGERTLQSEGNPLHIELNNQGEALALRLRENAGVTEMRWSGEVGHAAWLAQDGISETQHDISSLEGALLIREYDASVVLTPAGINTWQKSEPLGNAFSLHRMGDSLAVLGFRRGKDLLELLELSTGKALWSAKSQPANGPETPGDMRLNSILHATLSGKGTEVLTLSSVSSFTEEDASLIVGEHPVNGASQPRQWKLKADAATARAIKGYGAKYELFGVPSPVVLMDTSELSGELHQCVLYECSGEALAELLRWSRSDQIPSHALPGNQGLLVDMSDEHKTRHEAGLVRFTAHGVEVSRIQLPGRIRSMLPSPTGKHCLFSLEEGMVLWNLTEMRQVGQFLAHLDGNMGEVRVNSFYQPFWDHSDAFFYLKHHGGIYQYEGMSGGFIRRFHEHTPRTVKGDQPEITTAVLSPDGSWLASGDKHGRMVISRTRVVPLALEELQTFSRNAGGLEVHENGDLVPWSP